MDSIYIQFLPYSPMCLDALSQTFLTHQPVLIPSLQNAGSLYSQYSSAIENSMPLLLILKVLLLTTAVCLPTAPLSVLYVSLNFPFHFCLCGLQQGAHQGMKLEAAHQLHTINLMLNSPFSRSLDSWLRIENTAQSNSSSVFWLVR